MKKIFTLAVAAAAAFGMQAANFALYHGGDKLADGESYTIGYVCPMPGALMMEYNLQMFMTGDMNTEYVVEVTSEIPDGALGFCGGFDENCVSCNPTATKEGLLLHEGMVALDIHGTVFAALDSDKEVTVKAYAYDAPDEAVTVKVICSTEAEVLPETLYLIGNVCDWDTNNALAAKGENGIYTWENVDMTADDYQWFAFLSTTGADWNAVNEQPRYGALAKDEPIELGSIGKGIAEVICSTGKFAGGSNSWKVASGTYNLKLSLLSMTLELTEGEGAIQTIDADASNAPAVYYDLRGVRVEEPAAGNLYIRVQGTKATKVIL